MLKDFKAFILRGNVVDLAIAVIIGAAFTAVITSLVEDIFTPFLAVFGDTNSTTSSSTWAVARSSTGTSSTT